MASLSSSYRIGNIGASSLIKSANNIATAQQDYQDKLMALNWQMSAQTSDDWAKYSQYLQTRASNLANTGTLADSSKALTIQSTYNSAQKSFTSNEIQRSSIAILEGNANLSDKQSTVDNLYQLAVNNGDMNLAQNLLQQHDNISQQIQYQQQQAAQASQTLYTANASHQATAQVNAATALDGLIKDLTNEYKNPAGGASAFNKTFQVFAKAHPDTLQALGIDASKNVAPNMAGTIAGLIKGQAQYYLLAATAAQGSDPTGQTSQGYIDKATSLLNGETTFNTPYGTKGFQDLQQIAANPNSYVQAQNENGQNYLTQSTPSGLTFDANGNIIATPTGHTPFNGDAPKDNKAIEQQLKDMGFGEVTRNSNGTYKVQITDAVAKWLPPDKINSALNGELTIYHTAQGFQFQTGGPDAKGHLFTIAQDAKGLHGVFETLPNGTINPVHGQYGFNGGQGLAALHLGVPVSSAVQKQTVANALNPAASAFSQADPLNVMGIINHTNPAAPAAPGRPQMVQRAGGGFNYVGANGQAISAYTYAKQTGQQFRSVLQQAASKGDVYSQQALQFAGNDGAYNPATVSAGVAKNWNSLIWGNSVNLQTPQAYRVSPPGGVGIFKAP